MNGSSQQFKAITGTAVLASGFAALAVLFWFDPAQHAIFPVCPFHRLTGLNCPGCGGLRAVHHLAHGRVLTAFHYNPLLVASLPLVLLAAGRWLIQNRANRLSPETRILADLGVTEREDSLSPSEGERVRVRGQAGAHPAQKKLSTPGPLTPALSPSEGERELSRRQGFDRLENNGKPNPPPLIGSYGEFEKIWRPRWFVALVLVIILFGVLRNLPFPAFAWMSP